MITEELSRLFRYGERHRRLTARLVVTASLTAVVCLVGTALVWLTESGQSGGDIKGLGDSAFFTVTQLLTVSSSLQNPVTAAGKVVDVGLELWALFVITAVAGSFATFFGASDTPFMSD